MSTDVSSTYLFHELAEALVLTAALREKYGMFVFLRFKDDIFYIVPATPDNTRNQRGVVLGAQAGGQVLCAQDGIHEQRDGPDA